MANGPGEIEKTIDAAVRWLILQQDSQGGWAERKGESPSSLNTAEVLCALVRVRKDLPHLNEAIPKAVRFLEEQQTKDGVEAGSWPRYVRGQPRCPDLLRTSAAIEALAEATPGILLPSVERGIEWLAAVRSDNGGWGYRRGAPAAILPTCFVLSALLAAYPRGDKRELIDDALAFLVKGQRARGSFGTEGDLEAVSTALALLCLQRAANCDGLGGYEDERKSAVEWLEGHRVEATKEVEATIEIDPDRDDPSADYSFVFMTEALVARAVTADTRQASDPIAREALETLYKGIDPDGGFYGRRVFSWSTARALQALESARTSYSDFPQAPRAAAPRLIGHFMLGFCVLVVAAIVFLSATGHFGPVQATVFIFIALVALVGYRIISETTFRELAQAVLRPGTGAKKS